jgi:hypothetical protein
MACSFQHLCAGNKCERDQFKTLIVGLDVGRRQVQLLRVRTLV